MIDLRVATILSHNLKKNCIVVFSEAYRIDKNAIGALGIFLNKQALLDAKQNIKSINKVGPSTAIVANESAPACRRCGSDSLRRKGVDGRGIELARERPFLLCG